MTLQEPTKLRSDSIVRYTVLTPKHGRAEFVACPIWKNGAIEKIYIQRIQQETTEMFVIEGLHPDCKSMSLDVYEHLGFEHPKTWLYMWCDEHQTMQLRWYVPRETDHFQVRSHSWTVSLFHDRLTRFGGRRASEKD